MSGDLHVLYRLHDAAGDLLYVGITLNVHQRFATHRADKAWWREVASIALEHFPDRESLEMAEQSAIAAEKPRENRQRRFPSTHPERFAAQQRRARLTRDQHHWFKAVRRIAHRGVGDRCLDEEVARARDRDVPEEDIQWALDHPIRFWGPNSNHPQSRTATHAAP